jgi:hypothetical protein
VKKHSARFAIFFSLLCSFLIFSAQDVHAQQFSYNLSAAPGANPGQVTLAWTQLKPEVKNYNILYGPENNKSQYGAVAIDGNTSVGKSVTYTVNYLSPNTNYFFTLVPIANGKAVPLNFQVTSLPKPGSVTPPPSTSSVSQTPPSANFTGPISIDTIQNQSKANIKSNGVGLHQLSVKKTKAGEVVLTWQNALADTTGYSIVYSDDPNKLKYGALHIGKNTTFKIDHLDPKKTYYFALVPEKENGKAQYITQEASSSPVGNPSPSNTSASSGNNSNSSAGSPSTTNTNTNTTNTTNPTSGGGATTTTTNNPTKTSGSSGGTSGGQSTTTSTSKKDDKKSTKQDKSDKKVKGAETSEVVKPTIWDLIKKFFGL